MQFSELSHNGYDFENPFVTYEELYNAYEGCLKRKKNTANAKSFMMNETRNLYSLYYDLNSGRYEVGKSICFVVHKPVDREIFAADFRDRIVHHLLIDRLMVYLEKEFIEDSFSCRKGKGTQKGVFVCRDQINNISEGFTKETYIMKCDLQSFFMTIDKGRLVMKMSKFIDRYITDERDNEFDKHIMGLIVNNCPQKNCIIKGNKKDWEKLPSHKSLFNCDDRHGLPIGNLTSQLFANYYLNDVDHYIEDILGFKGRYGRYVDDFYLISNDKKELLRAKKLIKERLAQEGVRLHPKKCYIQEVRKGIKFIGAVIKPNRIYIANRTKGNLWECINDSDELLEILENSNYGMDIKKEVAIHFCQQINSYCGFMKHYKTYNIRKRLLTSSSIMNRWQQYIYHDEHLLKYLPYKEYSLPTKKKRRGCKLK